MATTEITARERTAAQRFIARIKDDGSNIPHTAKKLEISEQALMEMEAGHRVLPFRTAFRAAQTMSINLLWLASGEGDPHHHLPSGLAFLDTAENSTKGFIEVFDSHVAEFAARAGTERCGLKLCRAFERAKAALATRTMTEAQETTLRAALAPWLI